MKNFIKGTIEKIVNGFLAAIGRHIFETIIAGGLIAVGTIILANLKTVVVFYKNTVQPFIMKNSLIMIICFLVIIIIILSLITVRQRRVKGLQWLKRNKKNLFDEYSFLFWFILNNVYRAQILGITSNERMIICSNKNFIDVLSAGVLKDRYGQGSEYEMSEKVFNYLKKIIFEYQKKNSISKITASRDSFAKAILIDIKRDPNYSLEKTLY